MSSFYPRARRRDICDGEDPRMMCSARRYEVLNGSFSWDQKREGYVSTQLCGAWGIPILLDACPFCKELLPGANARRRFEAKLEAGEPPTQKLLPPPCSGPELPNPGSDATAFLGDDEGPE
jgi:hypothetical protein